LNLRKVKRVVEVQEEVVTCSRCNGEARTSEPKTDGWQRTGPVAVADRTGWHVIHFFETTRAGGSQGHELCPSCTQVVKAALDAVLKPPAKPAVAYAKAANTAPKASPAVPKADPYRSAKWEADE
jgi:hypothetical protein